MPPPTGSPGPPLRRLRTARGWRLVQHGTVLSEVLAAPGPTHSVFDVLAAAVLLHPAPRSVTLLGFGGGGLVAALRALGSAVPVEGVDLDARGHRCFMEAGATGWARPVRFHHADALSWLRANRRRRDVLIEDLSVPIGGEVEKPEASWEALPRLIATRLAPAGIAALNLLPPASGTGWTAALRRLQSILPLHALVHFDAFENRIALAAAPGVLPPPAHLGRQLRHHLKALGSSQADSIRVFRPAVLKSGPPP